MLRRAYGFSREQICRKVEELLATEELEIEAAHDTARTALRYRKGDADFADFMMLGAAQRTGTSTVWTFLIVPWPGSTAFPCWTRRTRRRGRAGRSYEDGDDERAGDARIRSSPPFGP